jgi:O-antigen ligase
MMREIGRTPRISRGHIESVGFICALALIFLRFSALPEVIGSLTGVNTYVLYLFGPVAVLAVLATGGIRRVFSENTVRYWLWFTLWMILAVPFSSWKGGSFDHVLIYVRTSFIPLVTTAALARNWADCRKIIYAVAAAAVFNMATAYLFQSGGSRLTFAVASSLGNSNDLAAHLLLVLPFVLFIALKPRTSLVFRLLSTAAVAFGIFQIFRTASRGAFIAILLTTVFVIARGTVRQKVAVGACAVVAFVFLTVLLPPYTWERLMTFSGGSGANEEALASSEDRQYLLKKSITYTLENPFFGVGPGQFASFEGNSMLKAGHHGLWHEAHNSYTQISSGCGIPALLFYLAAAISTFGLLGKIRKKVRGAYRQEILTASYCLNIALFAYSSAILFVNFGYRYELPAVSGLVVAMWFVVNRKASMPAREQALLGHPVPDDTQIQTADSLPPDE